VPLLKPLFGFKLAYDMHSSLPQQLTNFRFSESYLLIRIFAALERSALAHSEAVITICPDLYNYARAQGVQPERLFLIENSIFDDVRLANGADRTALPLAPLEQAVNPLAGPRIVYAGTFEPYQGVDLLVRAFAEVHRRRPDAELVLVGGRPDQGDAIRALAARLGLGDACRLTGQVSKAVARRWLESAAILVSPRIQGTNTPLKIYEQLASGKPLVATSIWSHTQVLTGEICFLVEPNADALAAGLLRALCDPAESTRRAGNAGRLYEGPTRDRYENKMRRFLEVLQ
jgi:glycosyltransferase involved in cell wall biosynthesis